MKDLGGWFTRNGFRCGMAAALIVALPTLGLGFFLDDYLHLYTLEGGETLGSPFDCFVFATGDPDDMRAWVDEGPYPWYTLPELKARFLRPLSSATMVIDHALFGRNAVFYHAQSILWYLVMVAAVALLYRRFLPPALAALTLLLFAVDDGHIFAAGWWSNRNALVAAAPAMLGVLAHVRWREEGWRPGLPLSLAGLAVGFLGGETALALTGYLGAYELLGRNDNLRRRIAALVPAAALSVAYLVLYKLLDRGAQGLEIYYDPIGDPAGYFLGLPWRFAMVAASHFFMFPVELAVFVPKLGGALALASMSLLALALWLFARAWPGLTQEERRAIRWLGAGAILSSAPGLAAFPSMRLLLVPSIGGAAVLAVMIRALLRDRRWLRLVGIYLVILHLVIAPLFWPGMTLGMRVLDRICTASVRAMPDLGVPLAEKTVFAVHVPNSFAGLYTPVLRALDGEPPLGGWHPLAVLHQDVRFTRLSENAFTLEPVRGAFMTSIAETLLRSSKHPFQLNETVNFREFSVTIDAMEDGRPTRIRVDTRLPLEDPDYCFLATRGALLEPFSLPSPGETVVLSAHLDEVGLAGIRALLRSSPRAASRAEH